MTPSEGGVGGATVRGRIALFLLLTFTGSAVIWVLMGSSEVVRSLSEILLMWMPGVAALLTCWLRRENWRDLGWSRGPWRLQLVSFLLPILLSFAVYGLVWSLGLGSMNRALLREKGGGTLLILTLGLAFSVVLTLGEEIGWRGLLVPALARRYGLVGVSLLSGLIWSSWHLPLIVFYGYRSSTPLAYAVFWGVVGMVSVSFPLAWLRLQSGSLWTAAILHGTHNIVVQHALDRWTLDTGPTEWFVGEFGCGVPLGWVFVALVVVCLDRRRSR